jgi:hypothetical protein
VKCRHEAVWMILLALCAWRPNLDLVSASCLLVVYKILTESIHAAYSWNPGDMAKPGRCIANHN